DTNGHAADSMRSGAHEGAAPPAMGPRAGPSRAGHVPLRGGVPGAYRNRATFLGGWARQSYGMRVDRGSGRERRRAGPRRSVGASTQAIVATTPSFSTSVAFAGAAAAARPAARAEGGDVGQTELPRRRVGEVGVTILCGQHG